MTDGLQNRTAAFAVVHRTADTDLPHLSNLPGHAGLLSPSRILLLSLRSLSMPRHYSEKA